MSLAVRKKYIILFFFLFLFFLYFLFDVTKERMFYKQISFDEYTLTLKVKTNEIHVISLFHFDKEKSKQKEQIKEIQTFYDKKQVDQYFIDTGDLILGKGTYKIAVLKADQEEILDVLSLKDQWFQRKENLYGYETIVVLTDAFSSLEETWNLLATTKQSEWKNVKTKNTCLYLYSTNGTKICS